MKRTTDILDRLEVTPIACGYRHDGDTSATAWALYNRADVERWAGESVEAMILGCGASDAAFELTGWEGHYSGPGRSFADDAWLRVVRGHVLVTQRRGLDV